MKTIILASKLIGIHYSNEEIDKIKPLKGYYNDPTAFYVFPNGSSTAAFTNRKYKYRVEINTSKILDLNKLTTANSYALVLKALKLKNKSPSILTRELNALKKSKQHAHRMWDLARLIIDDPDNFAKFFIKQGYDLLIDAKGKVILDGEPQYIILNKNIIQNIKKVIK